MADDWEDWESDTYQPPTLVVPAANGHAETKGQEILKKLHEPDAKKFEGEDEEDDSKPAWEKNVPKPEKKKESSKKNYEDKGRVDYDEPLDDPIAEKLRRQKLVEDADLEAAKAAFGLGVDEVDVDKLTPSSQKEFEEYARIVASKYISRHSKSKYYKDLLKAMLKSALVSLDVQQTKDLESCLAGIRTEKMKEDAAAKAKAKNAGKKKILNVGKSGGSAGLDDYAADYALDDEVDFM